MSTPYDPVVARALGQLVVGVDSDPDRILERARVTAQSRTRRRAVRLRRTAVLAFAALVLFASAAVAASRFDLFSWLDRSNRSSATFSIDNSRTYRGPAPEILFCPEAGARPFSCSLGYFPTSNRRAYFLGGRVEAQPHVSREFFLRSIAAEEQKGGIDHAMAERFRHDLSAVGDDFLAALNVLGSGITMGGAQQVPGRQGYELVPPAGVPIFIACESEGTTIHCHDLASSRNVPVGEPYYFLQSSRDWVAIPRESQKLADINRLFHVVLGRDLTQAEGRFMFVLANVGSESGSSGSRPLPTKPEPSKGGTTGERSGETGVGPTQGTPRPEEKAGSP